jgi:hypothetical protein
MPKTLDFTGFSGNFPLKKKAGFTRYNKKAISYYMFLYPQARPDLMRAGVCVTMPQEADELAISMGLLSASYRKRGRSQIAAGGRGCRKLQKSADKTGGRRQKTAKSGRT